MKKKIEYLVAISISLLVLAFGFFNALAWYWSGFKWSPLGYETCGMEFLAILLFAWPAFIFGLLWYPVKTPRPMDETYKQMLLKISEGKE